MAQTPSTALALSVPNLTVPAGGTAQIQVYLGSPVALVSGEVSLSLDPTIFGAIASADVFSVNGDQVGTANIQDRSLDVQFRSLAGGVGRRADLPVLVVSAPVLATAAAGTTSLITVKAGATQGAPSWRDVENVTYAVTPASGTLTVGGSLSVTDVAPGGGILPAGTMIRIDGTGFTASSSVTVEGAAASVQFFSPTELDFTLAAGTDLTGKRIAVTNAGGAQAVFFPALRGGYVARPASGPLSMFQPIFPQQLYPAAALGNFSVSNSAIALQNPSLQPLDVMIETATTSLDGVSTTASTVTLPPGGIYVVPGNQVAGSERAIAVVVPTSPIRVALVDPVAGGSLAQAIAVPTVQPYADLDGTSTSFYNTPLTLNWAVGRQPPAPQTLAIVAAGPSAPFTISAATQSGGAWLLVSPGQGMTCNNPNVPVENNCAASSKVVVSVNPSNLAPGAYNGSLTITPMIFGGQATTVSVLLNVSATRQIFASPLSFDYGAWTPDQPPVLRTVGLTSNGDPLPFSVAVATASGQNWIAASPITGNTPATLTLTADPSKQPAAGDTATVTVTGPSNVQTIAVSIETATPQKPVIQPLPSVVFSVGAGQPPPAAQNFGFAVLAAVSPYTVSAQTADGGNWLSVTTYIGPGVPGFTVSVNQVGLAAGVYQGTVTISSNLAAGPAEVPVSLYVWNAPPPVTLSPTVMSFSASAVSAGPGLTAVLSPIQTVNIATGGIPIYYTVATSTSDGANWLIANPPSQPVQITETLTPATLTISVIPVLAPGVYHGVVTVTAPPGSSNQATLAVTLTVTPSLPVAPQQGTLPLATSVVSAASNAGGPVSPGEIVTIFGQNFGPYPPVGFETGPNGKVATNLGGAQVLFDGVAAPVIYANGTQVNAIVPYEVAGSRTTNVQLNYTGTPVPVGEIPVTDAAPGIFTVGSTGQGGAAVLNQDGSVNSTANPAVRGSTMQIFATGEGVTSPAGVTGEITGNATKEPLLPVTVTMGGVAATVVYAGSAPDAVAGLFQVNAVVPQGVTPGTAALVLTLGDVSSQGNVTIAVR